MLDYLWWYLAPNDPPTKCQPARCHTHTAILLYSPPITPRTAQRSEHFPGGRGGGHVRFCQQEYDYDDRIPDMAPYRIEPIDVMVTIAMNSFVNNATMVRLVHRGLAGQYDSILHLIPADADLLTFDPQLKEFEQLIHAAVQARQVLVPVATKVLHRKRRGFIPMLDNVVMGHYIDSAFDQT